MQDHVKVPSLNSNIAFQAAKQSGMAPGETQSIKDQFRVQLGADRVTISENMAALSQAVSKSIRMDGTKAFADKPERGGKVTASQKDAVKAIGEDAEREGQRKDHQDNMARAKILNGFINKIASVLKGDS